MAQPRISILAIGTELTNGQIINRNASWISARLSQLGIPTIGHWTIPDQRDLIRQTLDFIAPLSDLIFVTGGLGPTSDDFTREALSDWTETPLVWDEASWTHIQNRLSQRGIQATDIQKQQCYFPKGATILTNSNGTAHGFRYQGKQKTLIVLPGPPREIEAIWKDHLQAWLPSQFPGLDPLVTRIWDTIGQPESHIAQLTEEALKGCGYERGYRVHLPYVEAKISFLKSQEATAQKWVDQVTQALQPYTVLRDGGDSARLLAEALQKFPRTVLVDRISGEYFFTRLLPHASQLWRQKKLIWSNQPITTAVDDLVLSIEFLGTREARALLQYKGVRRSTSFASPYVSELMKERERQYFVELAALFWARELFAISHA